MSRLFLDCDGVLADFDGGAARVLGMHPARYRALHGNGAFRRTSHICSAACAHKALDERLAAAQQRSHAQEGREQ